MCDHRGVDAPPPPPPSDAPRPGWQPGWPSNGPGPAPAPGWPGAPGPPGTPPWPGGGWPGGGWPGGGTRDHPQGTTILVLGILSLVLCGILGPVAWAMGNTARNEMAAQPGVTWTNAGNVTAGRICGMVATGFLALGVLIGVLAVAAAVSGA